VLSHSHGFVEGAHRYRVERSTSGLEIGVSEIVSHLAISSNELVLFPYALDSLIAASHDPRPMHLTVVPFTLI
jgi:hypothetical protein